MNSSRDSLARHASTANSEMTRMYARVTSDDCSGWDLNAYKKVQLGSCALIIACAQVMICYSDLPCVLQLASAADGFTSLHGDELCLKD